MYVHLFHMADTAFSYGRVLIVCYIFQESSKVKESSWHKIGNADTAFLLCSSITFFFKTNVQVNPMKPRRFLNTESCEAINPVIKFQTRQSWGRVHSNTLCFINTLKYLSIIQLQCREYMGHVGPGISACRPKFHSDDPGPIIANLLERLSVASISMFIAFHTPWWKYCSISYIQSLFQLVIPI